MRAAVVTRFGGPEVIEIQDLPAPAPGAGEALIDVELTDLIFVETAIREGAHGGFFDVTPPYVPGNSFGGVVRAVGEGVGADWIGKTVVGRTASFGAHAEQVVAPAENLQELPAGLALETAVAVAGDGITALMLEELVPALAGRKVLVTAAAGGMGVLLVQLAHRAGAQVIGAARGRAKLDLVKAQGADVVVDYAEPGWDKQVLEATDGHGPDVVFEGAGGALGATAFEIVADGGWFSAHGAASGGFAPYDEAEAERRGITVKGIVDLRADTTSTTVTTAQVLDRAARGDVAPVIDRVFPLDQLADAHRAMTGRQLVGKALIRIQ
ncbi:Alcohol dehydrogenase zinc-binding domain protein [Kribbella flavida DSM 17836]|uniref:Alcohol dehydrogenase zinc-binding domain protein n=1 Tax=Kribbella flavida (strain DSM 17836 / JCM 10339 / NBRC 14399) TaxID=479435 RepID=D2PZ76_KRIFD|nr:zinc-binding dehydrogenase [Kribbella flavida]ADB33685.1 Alcohol dehydrogenase zinc-binding domain protein [Kribbella flavida DSM 17836]